MDSREGNGGGLISEAMRERKLKGALLVLLLVLATYFLMKTFVEAKNYRFIGSGTTATNTIVVSGKGESFAVPDIAQFEFTVMEENMVVGTAQTAATKKANDIKDFLKKAGIAEKDIKTINYSINPHYEWETKAQICPAGAYCPPTEGRQVLKGYQVSESVSVKVRNTEKAGEMLAGVGTRGVQSVGDLNFTFDDPDKIQTEARDKAIEEARTKAKALARSLGVTLVRVVNFSEGSGSVPMYFKAMDTMVADGRGAAPPVSPEISVGENKVESNVTITYEIR